MDGLVADGFVLLGGPIGTGEHVLLAVEAVDEQEITERFRADPWLESEHLEIGQIQPWTIWLDGRRGSVSRLRTIGLSTPIGGAGSIAWTPRSPCASTAGRIR